MCVVSSPTARVILLFDSLDQVAGAQKLKVFVLVSSRFRSSMRVMGDEEP
jgi:hypothetical protein